MRMTLSRKITCVILGTFLISAGALFYVQRHLYSSGFSSVLGDLEQSILVQKREAATDILREVQIATEASLQRGEYAAFTRFAEQQKQVAEIQEFSFFNRAGRVELSSHPKQVGAQISPEIWKKAQDSKTLFVVENPGLFLFYMPLRVDADMRRLQPDWRIGELYGLLHLAFSKDKINRMVADARNAYQVSARRTMMIALIAVGIAGVLISGAGLMVSSRIVRPIRRGVAFAQAVAKGDLTSQLDIRQQDEVGELAGALNSMVANLGQMMRTIAENASKLAGASTELTTTATQLATGAEETTAQSTTVAAAATQMAANLSAMAASGEQMSANVRTVSAAVEQMTASIGEVARNAEQAANVADNAARLAEGSNQRIGELGSAADEIGKVIEVIQDIAEQTNLLALNATIEAARAGEAGKGFAVVATEVKELAKQTAHATEDIGKRIQAIQAATSGAVQSIGEIGQVIRNVNEVSRTIAAAVEEQSVTTREIAKNVAHAASASDAVSQGVAQSAAASQEITKSIGGVDTAARQTAQGAAATQTAGAGLSTLAGQLQAFVGQFKL